MFKAFRSDGVPFTTTFEYRHTFQNGQRVVARIRDTANGMNTTKTYDTMGRLVFERVDLQNPNGASSDPSDRFEERSYEYGSDGRVIFKDSQLRLSVNGPHTVPLTPPLTGQQTYVYAGERMVATVGAERFARATKFDFAYTPMTEAAGGGGTSRYVVQNGDSLVDIARNVYGDGALAYVIADANGIVTDPDDPLPTTEVGKAYEIPDVVGSSQTASTFKPYALAAIVGNDRPIAIPPPPPPRYSDIELMAVAAASIAIQVGATVGLSALGVPTPVSFGIGAGLGSVGSQATAWSLGMQAPGQSGIDWARVTTASMEGFAFSMLGPAAAVGRELWQQGKNGFDGWTSGPGLNWSGIAGSLFNVGFDALGKVLGPKVGKFDFGLGTVINSAYNPTSGFAIPGSGRRPTVGFFEFVANGLASRGYNWIRDQAERPSAPAATPTRRSVDDPRGPLPSELIDLWDEMDRLMIQEMDDNARAARNQQIAAASDESLQFQLRLGALQDRIDHFGERNDDRAIIDSVMRQRNAERVQREQAAAASRARAALRAARLRANTARIEAMMAKGPDPNLVQFVRDWEENDRQIVKDMYATGIYVRVSAGISIDGLSIDRGSGVYDTMFGRSNAAVDEEIRRYQEFNKADPMVGLEIILVRDPITPAEQARRLGLEPSVKTFPQFAKNYVKEYGTSEGVEKRFLEYHDHWSNRINANLDRIDNAAGAVNLIAKGTFLGAQFLIDPIGTVGSLVVELGTEKVLKMAGVDDEIAEGVSGLFGVATGHTIGIAQIAKAPHTSVRNLLRAERAARAEYDAVWMAARAAEFEMSKGIQIAEGVTLFRRMPPQAAVARPAGVAPGVLDQASESRALIEGVPIQEGGTVVNPDACTTNCVPVARVTDQTLRGNFANQAAGEPFAAASQPGQMLYAPKHFKTKRSTPALEFNSGDPARDLIAVETDMLSRPNSTAVIVGYRNPVRLPGGTVSESGHAFNAVNYNGRIFYVDGQTGVVLDAKQMFDVFMDPVNGYYKGVHVMPTGKLNFWVPSG